MRFKRLWMSEKVDGRGRAGAGAGAGAVGGIVGAIVLGDFSFRRPDGGNMLTTLVALARNDFVWGAAIIAAISLVLLFWWDKAQPDRSGLVGDWLRHADKRHGDHAAEIDALSEIDGLPDIEARTDRIVERNGRDQLLRVADTPPMRAGWAVGRDLPLHGWVHDVRDGLLQPLLDIDPTLPFDTVGLPDRILA